ncbi:MFS transporter [Bifidobacterium sp. BRDM6]|uniref:MFS transporter n=2 Tax=Bifidobacterium choloepi TaxID=2614131 RepID=A0A6I5N1C4_9BIFI|nr:MFS transporter [Bifidobacterium choloepi]NEG70407.1 MFS transporter [Bifidobacterium choloepi]
MFALPGAKAFCASAALARLPISMMSLGIVLALNYMYDNWTIAGAMSAAYVLAVAAVTPLYARLFDRYGQKRVGVPVLAIQVVVMFAFAFAALFRVPVGVLFVLAIVVGATQFSFGALVRTRWTYLLERTGHEDLMNTAYAFEAAVDEIVYILGPILAATLATSFHPVSQLFVPAVAVLVGGTVFFSLRRTEPPVMRIVQPTAVAADDVDVALARGDYDAVGTAGRLKELGLEDRQVVHRPGDGKTADESSQAERFPHAGRQAERQVRNVLLYAGILPLMLTFLIFNMSFSAFDVSLTAAMEEMGVAQFLGLQLAMIALGSFVGAIVFGSREHRGSHWRRMVICLVLLALGFAAMRMTMDNLIVLGIVEILGGFVVAPLLATGNLIVRDTVPEGALTEGLSWLSTANAVGTSMGSLVGGMIIDHIDSHAGVTMTWIVVAASIPFALLGWWIVTAKNRA